MNKTLLFIGAPHEALPAIGKAVALGYQVVICDGNDKAPGMLWAKKYQVPHFVASTYSYQDVLMGLERCKIGIDGIVAVACDVGHTVSKVALNLGLPSAPVWAADLSHDKWAFTKFLDKSGIATPLLDGINNAGWQIVKPNDGRGSRGVSLVHISNWDGYAKAVEEAKSYGNGVLVQKFVPGHQISSESIVWRGCVLFTGVTDRRYDFEKTAPYTVELGGVGPSRYSGEIDFNSTVQQLVNALQIKHGTIKCDIVLYEDKQIIIEAAVGRLSGGYMCSHYLPLAYGIDFLGAAFAVACGDNPMQYLKQTKEPRLVRGQYRNVIGAKNHTERGRFFLEIVKSN